MDIPRYDKEGPGWVTSLSLCQARDDETVVSLIDGFALKTNYGHRSR